MNAKIFVDTNILIYAHDMDASFKHAIANTIISKLWEEGTGVISTQVLQEFYVTITRKIPTPLSCTETRGIIESYLAWHIEQIEPTSILIASEIEERHHLSFWDALIITACRQANAEKIFTEDLNHGQRIEGILIENPFLPTNKEKTESLFPSDES